MMSKTSAYERALCSCRRVGAATLVCSAFGLAFIPAATAKREREAAAGATTVPAQTTAPAAPAASATPSSSTGTPTTSPPRRHSSASAHGADPVQNTGRASAEEGVGTTQQAGKGREPAARKHAGRASGSATGADASAAGPEQAVSSAAKHKEGKEGKKGKEGKGKEHEGKGKEGKGKEGKGKEGKGKEREGKGKEGSKKGKKSETPREEPPAEKPIEKHPVPVAGETNAAAAATALAAPAVTNSTNVTPAATVGLGTPTLARHHGTRHGTGARAHKHTTSHAAVAGSLVSGAGGLLATTTRPSGPSRQPATPAAHDPHSTSSGPVAPLVTTITKIVDVVPTPIRLVIAGLLALALALAVRSRISALRARRLERQRQELLDDVGLLQAALLPLAPERLGPVGTSAAYEPAAGPAAGGDFYDVFALDDDGQLGVIVGDVSGHGRQALPHTALVRFTLRAYLEAGLSPRDAVQTAGAVLERQLGGAFATVIVATYDPRERVLVYSCAGHPPPVVLGGEPDAGPLAPVTISTSPPIGVGMRTGTRQTTISLPGRAQVCFYTDGITEARVGSELFGTERLVDALRGLGPEATAADLLAHVSETAHARPDDMAACLLSVDGPVSAPAVLLEELEIDREEAAGARTESFLRACGVGHGEATEVIRSASAAAGRAGTVVLEVSADEAGPQITLRRDHVARLHARRDEAAQRLQAEVRR